jgi:hypothetical protein
MKVNLKKIKDLDPGIIPDLNAFQRSLSRYFTPFSSCEGHSVYTRSEIKGDIHRGKYKSIDTGKKVCATIWFIEDDKKHFKKLHKCMKKKKEFRKVDNWYDEPWYKSEGRKKTKDNGETITVEFSWENCTDTPIERKRWTKSHGLVLQVCSPSMTNWDESRHRLFRDGINTIKRCMLEEP